MILQLVASALTLLSMVALASRLRSGWLMVILAQVVWLLVVWDLKAWGLLPIEVVLLGTAAVGFWRWR